MVLEEWRTRRGAAARIRDVQYPVLFGDSRYAERLPIGLPEVIEAATSDDLRGFYERWYRPDLMAVIAVGDFDGAEMVETIRRHFAPPPEGATTQARAARPQTPTVRPDYPLPPHAEPRISIDTDPELSAATLQIYAKMPSKAGQNLAVYRRLLAESLFSMMANARLFERTQVADPPFLGAWFGRGLFLANTSVLYASARLDEEGVGRGLDTVLEEMQRILRYGFTATELEREKANLLRSIESTWREREQRPSIRLAEEYIRHFLDHEPVPGIDAEYRLHQQMLPRITLQEVNRLAEPWRTLENTVVLVSGPEAVASGTEAEQEMLAKLTGAVDLEVAPIRGSGQRRTIAGRAAAARQHRRRAANRIDRRGALDPLQRGHGDCQADRLPQRRSAARGDQPRWYLVGGGQRLRSRPHRRRHRRGQRRRRPRQGGAGEAAGGEHGRSTAVHRQPVRRVLGQRLTGRPGDAVSAHHPVRYRAAARPHLLLLLLLALAQPDRKPALAAGCRICRHGAQCT